MKCCKFVYFMIESLSNVPESFPFNEHRKHPSYIYHVHCAYLLVCGGKLQLQIKMFLLSQSYSRQSNVLRVFRHFINRWMKYFFTKNVEIQTKDSIKNVKHHPKCFVFFIFFGQYKFVERIESKCLDFWKLNDGKNELLN